MDTDYLTPMAFGCIRQANEVVDVLKSELGAACSRYPGEDEYLQGILEFVKYIENDPEEYLDQWNLLDHVDIVLFRRRIKSLCERIEHTISTPIKDRGIPPFSL